MTLPSWITSTLTSTVGKLHISSNAVKIAGVVAALCIGFFGHDWQSGAEVAIGALATSAAISTTALVKGQK